MTWHPSLADRSPLLAVRLALRRDELRLYLRLGAAVGSAYEIRFEQVAAFSDALPRGQEVRISDQATHGSFGWWLPADDPHRSVMIVAKHAGPGPLLVLARRVVYRLADEREPENWPG